MFSRPTESKFWPTDELEVTFELWRKYDDDFYDKPKVIVKDFGKSAPL